MTLEEAILNEEKKAKEQEKVVYTFKNFPDYKDTRSSIIYERHIRKACECAKEHRQIAEWLKKLKEQKSVLDKVRTEIEGIIYEETVIEPGSENEYIISKVEPDDVLAIIDKYRTESEE